MNKNLEKLIEVNRLDLEVSKYDPLIEQKKAPMNEKISEKTKALKEKQELEALIARNEESLAKNNDEFAVITADIERIRNKIQESKSIKAISCKHTGYIKIQIARFLYSFLRVLQVITRITRI